MLRILALAALVALAPATATAARGPSTPEERRRAVETVRKLEKQPLARSSNEARRWLLQWIVDIPDISVTLCSGPLDALAEDEESPYAKMLYVQAGFGMAAFLVENPRKVKDWAAVQTAGLESVLRAYDSVLRADPEARLDVLDRLETARKTGKLRKVVETDMAECGKPPSERIPENAI